MNFPILSAITFIPIIGALFVFLTRSEKDEKNSGAIYISIFTSIVNFFIILFVWYSIDKTTSDFQFIEEYNWISGFIKFKFGIDGISILFILLTAFIIYNFYFFATFVNNRFINKPPYFVFRVF